NAHCGACGNHCGALSGASNECVAGSCVADCLPGFIDLDGDMSNGCEYECTKISDEDRPDDNFIDANCDGIDGDIAKAIFVSPWGSDNNPGTMEAPVLTIAQGLRLA